MPSISVGSIAALQVDFPGYPKGTTMTLGADGVYHSADGKFWMNASYVTPSGTTYYTVNTDGTVSSSTTLSAQVLPNNYFLNQNLAQQTATLVNNIIIGAQKS